jgi:tripartite-type tricarboxylate transporter receptor subunit TctC
MKRYQRITVTIGLMVLLILAGSSQSPAASSPASAAKVKDSFANKTLTITISSAPGNSQDMAARIAAPYLQKEMGLRQVNVVNEDAATGMAARNKFFSIVKPDGLTLLADTSGAMWTSWTMGEEAVKYDITKFEYLGGIPKSAMCIFVPTKGAYQTIEAMQKSTKVVFSSATGPGSLLTLSQFIVWEIFGINAKTITGYKGGAAAQQAVVQNEVDAGCLPVETTKRSPTGIKEILLISDTRDKNFNDVPAIGDLLDLKKLTAHQKMVLNAFPQEMINFMAPPHTPQETVQYLRNSMNTVFANPAFQADIKKLIDYWPGTVSGEKVQQLSSDAGKKRAELAIFKSFQDKYIKK